MFRDNHFKYICSLCLVLFLPFELLLGQSSADSVKKVVPLEISRDFNISAELKHPAWKKASPIHITHQVMPNDDAPAKVNTEVKVLYSKDNLYVGFICQDPRPQNIRASISDRDNSFSDDFVGIFLDPFNNNQYAYQLFVNPLGIQMDGMRAGNSEDMNFDMLWYTDGKITDTGYQVAIKIPFKSLNYPERDIQNWSIQFMRNYPRSKRYQFSWTDIDLNNSCLLCQSGKLTGMKGVESTNTVELLPYAMSYQSSSLSDPANPGSGLDHGPVDGRLGGSISYTPSSTTSINAVVNPDFSQVETDAAQIGANETFALYYPEKRPFFMKGADMFSTPENLFYSRMINRPLAAGKFTQQANNYSFAFLTAYDRSTPYIIPGRYGSSLVRSEINAYSNILRGKYNFGSESYIGGLLTTRNQGEGANYVGSVDWNLRLADHYYLKGQLAYSDTKELSDTTLFNASRKFGKSSYDAAFNGEQYGGSLISSTFSRRSKHYNFSFGYKSYSPTFQSQNGFINQTNRRQLEASQRYSYYPGTEWLSRGSFSVSGTWRYDFDGQFQERFIYTRLSNNFGGQTNLNISYLPVNDERFRGKLFTDMSRVMINASSKPMDGFSFGGNIDFGEYIFRSSNPVMGKGFKASANATVKPSNRLELNLNYSYSTLSSLDGSQNFYSGDIIRMTGRYNFTRKLFARFITQYNSFNEQIQLYPLVYYKVNPFTKFYMGMTDYMNKFDQSAPGGFNGYRETDRQFFVKFQYLIRS